MERKFIGTIFDASYFEPYMITVGSEIMKTKICLFCNKSIILSVTNLDTGETRDGVRHSCPESMGDLMFASIVENCIPINGFIFRNPIGAICQREGIRIPVEDSVHSIPRKYGIEDFLKMSPEEIGAIKFADIKPVDAVIMLLEEIRRLRKKGNKNA